MTIGLINKKETINADNGLVQNRCQAIIWPDPGLIYRCMYASFSPNESNSQNSCPIEKILIEERVLSCCAHIEILYGIMITSLWLLTNLLYDIWQMS